MSRKANLMDFPQKLKVNAPDSHLGDANCSKSADRTDSSNTFFNIFEHAGDMIIYMDTDGIISNVNLKAEVMIGYSPQEMIGKKFCDASFLVDGNREILLEHFMSLRQRGDSKMIEVDVLTKNGELKFIEIHSNAVIQNGHIEGYLSIARDITERRKREEILRKSEEKFKIFFENANDGIVYLDNNAVIRAENKKLEELFGYSREEIIGRPFIDIDFLYPSDMKDTYNAFKESIDGKLPPLLEFEGIHRDGSKFYLEINPTLIKENDEIIGMLAILRDITSRKIAQEERARLIDIIEATPDFVFTYDSNGKITYINRAGRDIIGLSNGDDISSVLLPSFQDALPVVVSKGIWKGETTLIAKNKAIIQVSQVIMAHQRSERDEVFYSAIMRDITEQKQNEKHIKHLTHQLIKVQEDERLRISRDLHDNLAQDLSSLKILCETLFDYDPEVPEPLRKKVSGMSKIFQRSIDSVRDLTYNLRPASLDQLGLVNTIYQYCEEFHEKNGIDVEFYSAGMKHLKLDFDTEINIYRIVQEALNNIKKHAQADFIKVNLISSYPTIILQIEDNGSGFEIKRRKKELINEKRMGLKSIEERVELLKGKFRIQSKKQFGTRIHVEVPYKERMCGQQINSSSY